MHHLGLDPQEDSERHPAPAPIWGLVQPRNLVLALLIAVSVRSTRWWI